MQSTNNSVIHVKQWGVEVEHRVNVFRQERLPIKRDYPCKKRKTDTLYKYRKY